MRHAVGLRRSEGATHILSATPLPEASPMDWRPAERLQTGPATPLAAHIASLTVGGTDRVDLNIAALNSHDGTSAFRILVTPVPVVREHPERRAEQPRVVVLDPPHPQRQFRRPDRPRGARTDLHLRRRVPGRGRAADPAEHDRRRVRRADRRHLRQDPRRPPSGSVRASPAAAPGCTGCSRTPTPRPASATGASMIAEVLSIFAQGIGGDMTHLPWTHPRISGVASLQAPGPHRPR